MDNAKAKPALGSTARTKGERITPRERFAYEVQIRAGHLAFFGIGPAAVVFMRLLRGNTFEGLAEVRRAYREAAATGRPLLICANHLTMFDSIFLHYALASVPAYLKDFRLLAWNVPAVENFKRDPFLRALTYLAKTIPIDRGGNAAHYRSVLERIKFLAARGEIFTIFPEGGRSRTGRVEKDRAATGVGTIVRDLEAPLVLCVYMRGARQESLGVLPLWGDVLHVSAKVIAPTTDAVGLRAAKELSRQIVDTIGELEARYFASRGELAAR